MSFPKDLNFVTKPISVSSKPSINRYRSDNSTYSGGDTIRIEIPTGKNGQFLFPTDSFIEFKVKLNYSTTAAAVTNFLIDGNIYSLFSRMRLIHSSTVIEDTMYCNKLWNALYDINSSETDRRNDCITKLVFDTTANAGQVYNAGSMGVVFATTAAAVVPATDSSTFDATFVLPSALLGSLAHKALPLGEMGASSLYLELELAHVAQSFVTTLPTGQLNNYTVSDIYYNAKITTLNADVNTALMQSMGNIIELPAVSYKTELKTISSNSSSFNDKFSFQYSSIKNFLFLVQNSSTNASTSQTGVNSGAVLRSNTARTKANISEYFLSINGESYPSQSIMTASRMYSELQRAFDCLTDAHSGILSYKNYVNSTTGIADDVIALAAVDSIQKRFVAGIDLDKFNHASNVLMCGTNTIGQNVNLNIIMSVANAEALALVAAVQYDILYSIVDGQIIAKF